MINQLKICVNCNANLTLINNCINVCAVQSEMIINNEIKMRCCLAIPSLFGAV